MDLSIRFPLHDVLHYRDQLGRLASIALWMVTDSDQNDELALRRITHLGAVFIDEFARLCQPEGAGQPDGLFARAVGHMVSLLPSCRGIGDICATLDVSQSSLYRCFMQHAGISPQAYLKRLRVENARHLLDQGMSLSEVCKQVGIGCERTLQRLMRKEQLCLLRIQTD